MKRPFIIGITGGIGSGKSTLAAKLRNKGFSVFDSDAEAKRIQNEDVKVREKIIEIFGNKAYNQGILNRKRIADIVFKNPKMLSKLTEIVHPAVINHFNLFISTHQNDAFIFLESAVLFESGLNKLVDVILVVTASEKERIKRVIARDKTSENEIKLRMKNQINEQNLLQFADIIINTELEEINVEKIIQSIKELKTKKGAH